jgi:hypothetical protein
VSTKSDFLDALSSLLPKDSHGITFQIGYRSGESFNDVPSIGLNRVGENNLFIHSMSYGEAQPTTISGSVLFEYDYRGSML